MKIKANAIIDPISDIQQHEEFKKNPEAFAKTYKGHDTSNKAKAYKGQDTSKKAKAYGGKVPNLSSVKPPITTREGQLGPVVKSNQGVSQISDTIITDQTKPVDKKRKPDPNKYWNFKEFKEAYTEKMDESELTPKEKAYFDDYAKQAQFYLERPNTKWQGKTPLNGKMFAEAAKRMYLRYGKDMSKVVPLEMALSQAQFESHFGLSGRSAEKNPFNIGEHNTSTAGFVKEIEDASMGVATYYHLMAEDYLSAKKPEQLLQDFTNERGNRYQVNDNGVVDHKYEKRLRIQIDYIQRMLKQMPGGYTPTFRPPVATHQTTAHKPKASKITHVPLPKSTSGFSVGMPGGKYTTSMINFPEDVRRMQQKLLEVGLLSETDYTKEYPKEKKAKTPAKKPDYSDIQRLQPQGLQEAKNQDKGILAQQKEDAEAKKQATLQQTREALLVWLQSLTDEQVRAMAENPALSTVLGKLVLRNGLMGVSSRGEMISQLMALRGQNIMPLTKQDIPTPQTPTTPEVPYVHYLTDFEQAAMDAYGKVPLGDPIPIAQLTKTIAAIEVFQQEVKGGTVDGRIDPNGATLGQLMGATKESVAAARKAYQETKRKISMEEEIYEILDELGKDLKREYQVLIDNLRQDKSLLGGVLKILLKIKKEKKEKNKEKKKNVKYTLSKKLAFYDKIKGGNEAEFINKVIEIGKDLKIDPNWLMVVMYSESGLSHTIPNSIGAVGLIQFLPGTAQALGTNTKKLVEMSNVEQLDYVHKYFKGYAGKFKDVTDLYLVAFYPLALGKSDDWVVGSERGDKYARLVGTQNFGFDLNKDGLVTIGEFRKYIRKKFGTYLNALK